MIRFDHYFKSGSDSWTTDYATQKEAEDMVEETNKKYCNQAIVPDYYIKATYIGEVKV